MNEEEEKKKFLEELQRIGATRVTGYSTPELKGQVNEDTRSTVAPTPAVEKDDEATPTGYDYLQQFTEKYTPEVLTQDELNRRKRAAHVMSGIGALGNAANAISNLIFTDKGAPSQTLPKNVDASAEIAKLEETEKAKRNEIYQRAKDRVAQQQAREALEYKYAKDAQDNQYKAAELKIKMDDLVLKKDKAEREGRLDEARILTESWKAVKAQYDALAAPALNKARTSNYNSGSAANYARAEYYKNGGSGSRSELEIPYNGGTFQVSKNNWNNMSYLSAVAKDLGVPIQYKRVKDDAGVEKETVTMTSEGRTIYLDKGELQAAIGAALNDPNNAKVKSAVERITKGRILEEEEEAEVIDYIPDKSKKKKEEPEEYQ